MRQCAAIWRTARRQRTDAWPLVELRGSLYNCAHHGCAAVYECAAERRVRGNAGARQHTGARHHGVRGTTQRRKDHSAARAEPWSVGTCKRHGRKMRGTIRRENPRKHGCAEALTVRGTIANIDVNEAATNEMIRCAATIKKNLTFVTDVTDVTLISHLNPDIFGK